MWTVDVPPAPVRSALPAGGSPADDRNYLAWKDVFLAERAERDVARRWHDAIDRPPRLEPWRLDGFLFAALGGPCPLLGGNDPVVYQHRLRFLAISFRTQRRTFRAAAARFAEAATVDGV